MRVIILHFLDRESKNNDAIVRVLADSASRAGHIVEIVDGTRSTDSLRLTPYEYVVVFSPAMACLRVGFIVGWQKSFLPVAMLREKRVLPL